MSGSVPVELLQRFLQATPEQQAAIARILADGHTASDSGDSSASEPQYALRKGHRVWQLVFEGRESFLSDEKGLGYVAVLLREPPGEPMPGAALAERAFGDLVIEGQRNLALDDQETVRATAAARRKCRAVLADPVASELEQEEARAELEEINAWARTHLRGTTASEQRQVRAIRQAIRRLLEGLQSARDAQGRPDAVLQSFGEHLEQYLWRPSARGGTGRHARVRAGLAGRFTYEPPPGVKWSA